MRVVTAFRRLRARTRGERGVTLVELMVGMAIMSIVLVVCSSLLSAVQTEVGAQTDRTTNNDQARLALEQIDRQVRSGNILYDPMTDDPVKVGYAGGMYLRIYTQSNGVPFHCAEWRVRNNQLQERERAPGENLAWPTAWRDVADDIRNVSNNVPAFQLAAVMASPGVINPARTLDVTMLINSTPSNTRTLVTITENITGRNTTYGYPNAVCDPFVPN
jgi:prepilin-type N-terminal cleavage/methylation domain-containing protein